MKIYKVIWFVNRKKHEGFERKDEGEEIIINNLETAKWAYHKHLNECNTWMYYRGYSGACKLFVPHQFENGLLASWPDKENYIEQKVWE